MKYIVVGIRYIGGDGFVIQRQFENVTEEFDAKDDDEAKEIVKKQYGHISNPTIYREIK